MALVIGNKRIQSIVPQYDGAGVLTGIVVRVNRDIVENSTAPPTFKYGLPTSREVDILSQLTPTQQTGARTFLARIAALVTSMAGFDE